MQFALGNTADLNDVYGDPFMVMLPANNQYSNNHVIPLFHNNFSTNFITVFVSPEHYQPEYIYVDDMSLHNYKWTAIHCPNNTICNS